MIVYLDASSFATLFLEDDGFETLERWLTAMSSTATSSQAFSDFGWGEFVSATSLRVRGNRLTEKAAAIVVAKARLYLQDHSLVRTRSADIAAATALVAKFDLKLKLPDALHIAIARRLDATLVTGDMRQANAAEVLGITVHNHLKGTPA